MPVARAAPPAATARTPARPTRGRRPLQADADTDALADDLSRVLRVSQPKVTSKAAPAAGRRPASSAKPLATKERTTTDAKSRVPAARLRAQAPSTAVAPKAPAPAARTTARVRTTSSTSAKVKGKAPALQADDEQPETLPWMTKAGGMSSRERAQAAQVAINATSRTLAEAIQAKFTYGTSSSKAAGEWTDTRVREAVSIAYAGVTVLRDIYSSEECGAHRLTFERGVTTLFFRCVAIQMYQQLVDMLISSKRHILRLYHHNAAEYSTAPSSSTQASSQELSSLADFPAPSQEVSEPVQSIINNFILAAWCCHLSLKADDPKALQQLIRLPATREQLHPFNLSPSLPFSSVMPMAGYLYRRVIAVPVAKGSEEWLHLRLITVVATSLTVSANDMEKRRNPPETIWHSALNTTEAYLECAVGNDAQRQVAEFIDHIVRVVEDICERRGESRAAWYTGYWSQVADIWIGVGRSLGDKSIINRALTVLGTSSTDAESVPPESQPPDALPSSPAETKTAGTVFPKTVLNAAAAKEEAVRCNAGLAKAFVDLTASMGEEPPTAENVAAALSGAELNPLLGPLCSLDDSDGSREPLTACLREVERLRRAVVKLFNPPETQSTLKAVLREWLVSYLAFARQLLEGATNKTPCAAASMPGCFDTTLALLRPGGLSEDTPSELELLDSLHTLLSAYGELLAPAQRSNYYFALTQTTHSSAVNAIRRGAEAEATLLAQRACDWSVAAVEGSSSADDNVPLHKVAEAISKRYELLGVCLQGNDRVGALRAYCQSVSWVNPAVAQQIADDVCMKPLGQVFNGSKDVDVPLRRCVAILASEDPPAVDFASLFWAEMQARNLPPAVCGALCEHLLDALNPAQYRPLVQESYLQLGDVLLGVYSADSYPLRRMRVNVRLMNLIATSGAAGERFDPFYQDTHTLWENQTAGEDTQLVPFKAEYYASANILRALNAHHQAPTSDNVAAYGKAALGVTRKVVFPPMPRSLAPKKAVSRVVKTPASTTSRAIRTPARATTAKKAVAPAKVTRTMDAGKVKPEATEIAFSSPRIGDPEQLAQLLNALSALCGICGHMVLKIEALNTVRAIQRTSDAMVDAYVLTSSQLAAEYGRLGKQSRAVQVFSQASKHSSSQKVSASPAALVDLHLRYSRFLAVSGHVAQAREQFQLAEKLSEDIPGPSRNGSATERWIQICSAHERSALAHTAHASIMMATSDATRAITSLTSAYRQWCRAAAGVAFIAAEAVVDADNDMETTTESEEGRAPKSSSRKPFCFDGKHLSGLQWYYAEAIFESDFALFTALAQRGSPKECEFYIAQARNMVPSVGSSTMEARTATHAAELESRRLHFDKSVEQLELAAEVLAVDGPDAVDIQRVRGELYSRQDDPAEADQMFAAAVERLGGLDGEFAATEALIPVASTSAPISPKSPRITKEPLLPHALGHVLRQRAWLLQEAGAVEEYDAVVQQLDCIPRSTEDKPEQLLLDARVAMHEAFSHFKTDLFMSSLTESTIAMTMGSPDKRAKERQSTRHSALVMLDKASHSFRKTLAASARTGRVEDVRQACISLVLLGAFQTALGHGSPTTTALAAGILASVPALTLHRELLPAIEDKFPDPEADDFDWPKLAAQGLPTDGDALATYWDHIRTKHEAFDFLHADYDLSGLPENWAVVGITVTDDRNTMLVSRHQNGHEPIVFCIPLDRQGKREGEDESELFTFDAGVAEFNAIIEGSNTSIKDIAKCKTPEDNKAWWKNRVQLDARLGELLATIEFCWLGAFKTVLNPRLEYNPKALQTFRERLDRIFQAALSASGSETRRGAKVKLNDTLLACFATLSSSKDEEIEDLVYFVLDVYQFHGIAVALAELDFDQIGVDVKSALSDLQLSQGYQPPSDEHLLLALDKNVQGLPWESIPILRGRAVSRIPSLPFLLDQVSLSAQRGQPASHFTLDAKRTTFFLNPSGDLTGTQARFNDRLTGLEKRGWTGVRGKPPTSEDMTAALTQSELVMYFGHGGGEQYISGSRVRALPRCAVTMLWGCSSGILRDQGDLDRTGTPNDYVLAGSPCLVANLWDVTDKDIDRLTAGVMDGLGLRGESGGEGGVSVVQAVSAARTVAKLQYLTGAAPVVYGIPVYLEL